jgi:hypothetical protein
MNSTQTHGPKATAKEYSLALSHLRQAAEEFRLAAHYVDGDEGTKNAINMLGHQVGNLKHHVIDLREMAEELATRILK